jgi:arylsulfatase A-like enzyme
MKNEKYNVILVNLDGLRKDKIDICSDLKLFKEDNTYFSKMISVSPYTLAAHHAIFSGLYPSQNGVDAYYHMFRFKRNELTTFPELLKNAGYYTKCDVVSENIIPTQGFDEVTLFDEKTVDFKSHHSNIIKEISKKEKFFLFLHYDGVHTRLMKDVMKKYDPKSNEDEYFKKIEENENRYNSYLIECNEYVKEIIKTVEELKNNNKTVLIFFADHGASIGEKFGEKFYGVYAYDYTIDSFCIMKIPNLEAKNNNKQCSILDIFPTVLELADVDYSLKYKIEGESLLNLKDHTEKEVFIETGGLYGYWPSPKKHNVFAIRYDDKKLIYNDSSEKWEFYNLEKDPKEILNIYDKNLEEVIKFKELLMGYLKRLNIDTKISK